MAGETIRQCGETSLLGVRSMLKGALTGVLDPSIVGMVHTAPVRNLATSPSCRASSRRNNGRSNGGSPEWNETNDGYDRLISVMFLRLSEMDLSSINFADPRSQPYNEFLNRLGQVCNIDLPVLPDNIDPSVNPVYFSKAVLDCLGLRGIERFESELNIAINLGEDMISSRSGMTPAESVARSFVKLLGLFTHRNNEVFHQVGSTEIKFRDLKHLGNGSLDSVIVDVDHEGQIKLGIGEIDGLAYTGDCEVQSGLPAIDAIRQILESSTVSQVFIEEFKLLSGHERVEARVLRQLLSYGIAVAGNLKKVEGMNKATLDNHLARINLLLLQGFRQSANCRVVNLADYIHVREDLTLEFSMDFENGQVQRLFRNGLLHIADLHVAELVRHIGSIGNKKFIEVIRSRMLQRKLEESGVVEQVEIDDVVTQLSRVELSLFSTHVEEIEPEQITEHDKRRPVSVTIEEFIGIAKSSVKVVSYKDTTLKLCLEGGDSVVVPVLSKSNHSEWLEYHTSEGDMYLFNVNNRTGDSVQIENVDLDTIRIILRYLNYEIIEIEERKTVYKGLKEPEQGEEEYGVRQYQERFAECLSDDLHGLEEKYTRTAKHREEVQNFKSIVETTVRKFGITLKQLSSYGLGSTADFPGYLKQFEKLGGELALLGLDFGLYSYWNPKTWGSRRYQEHFETPNLTFPLFDFSDILSGVDDRQVGYILYKPGNRRGRTYKPAGLEKVPKPENLDAFVQGDLKHIVDSPRIVVMSDNPLEAVALKAHLEGYLKDAHGMVAIVPRYKSAARQIATKIPGAIFIDISRLGFSLEEDFDVLRIDGFNSFEGDIADKLSYIRENIDAILGTSVAGSSSGDGYVF